ncbi:TonB-dependent siderophore receptor [Brevundimonas sp. WCHBH090558]|uniref:TonB-dependent siderophore receptor n=1 Tax=Brevundimonas huaxiensis TaxID=2725493 RepID=UPI0016299FD2|nr:TonB-dependent siderophore receptor [Brevundimonas huaxiensis]MBC1181198.1 TonB-dependent siderophore receptor [Brevundimonas huaxiensis]
MKLLLATASLAALFAAPAFAQDAPVITADDDATELDEITVFGRPLGRVPGETATKTGAPILDTPFTVNIVSRELLDLRNVSNIGEAAETVSGVQRTIGFSGNQRFRIRGFQNISTLRDGFRQSVSQPEIDLQGVESIEVLKGPASALYGRFEPGGVVNFVSKRPFGWSGGEAFVVGGSNDYWRGGLDVNAPITADGTVLARLNIGYENAGSYRDLVDNEQLYISPVVEWRPDAETSLLARLEYLQRDAAFDRGFGNNAAFLDQPVSRNYGEDFMRIEKEQWVAGLEFNRRLNADWRLRLGGFVSAVDVPEEQFFNYGFPPLSGTTVNRSFVSYDESQDDLTLEAELYGRVVTGPLTHRLLIGLDHSRDELSYLDGQIAYGQPIDLLNPVRTGRPTGYLPVGDSHYDYTSTGLYVQDEIAWNNWRLLLGGRLEEVETYAFTADFVDPGVSRTDRPFSPRAGLTYLLTPDWSIYGSWARSSRNEGDAGLLESGLTPKPTRGEQFEIGTKALAFDGRAELTLSAFEITKTDAVVSDPVDFNLVIQAGEIRVRGIEAEASARPLDPWTVVASYAYSDSEIAEDTNAFIVGNRLAGVPDHQAALWTSWAFDGSLTGLTIGGGVFHASSQAATTSNNLDLPGYTRVDLNAAYAFADGYEARLNVDNVTDETIFITGGFSQIYPQAPRTARLTLSKRW